MMKEDAGHGQREGAIRVQAVWRGYSVRHCLLRRVQEEYLALAKEEINREYDSRWTCSWGSKSREEGLANGTLFRYSPEWTLVVPEEDEDSTQLENTHEEHQKNQNENQNENQNQIQDQIQDQMRDRKETDELIRLSRIMKLEKEKERLRKELDRTKLAYEKRKSELSV